ncbi:hypothetical protein VNO80_25305 [Phaseolus coccineus]|uniref:Uncharacterized protein n=1 Tax=Phaseolus coccineus TaxID=3886 RepID=A0AAN9LV12_PHACN
MPQLEQEKDLAARAKLLKAAAQALPAEDLKLKAVAEVASSKDEDTCSGPIFRRTQRDAPKPTEHSASDGRAPSQQAPPPNPSPLRDIMV